MIEALIKRATPEIADRFVCVIEENEHEQWFYDRDGDKIIISGSSALCLACAYKSFLFDCCGGSFTQDHAVRYEELRLPAQRTEGALKRRYRLCLSYEFFSCAGCWWDWERWEKEIDFMAMNGVNMPLAMVGTQAVWFKTMMDCGMSEEFALAEISGPAYWGWQLSASFDAFVPQVKRETVESTVSLGRKIIEREKELGMTPVMHAWSGYISRLYIKAKLRARISRVPSWFNFASQYQVMARDTVFSRIGGQYLKNTGLLLGDSDYYIADPFYAHEPLKSKNEYFAGCATALLRCMTNHAPNARWIMHERESTASLIKAIDKSRLIIISDKDDADHGEAEVIRRLSFNGCDVTAMHGDMSEVIGLDESVSVAVESDGADSNEIMRLSCLEAAAGGFDKERLTTMVGNRWRTESRKAADALEILLKTVWSGGRGRREYASAIRMRPTLQPEHASIGDSGFDLPFDPRELFDAVGLMLECGASGHEFECDLADTLRQAMVFRANSLGLSAIQGYIDKNVESFEKNSNAFLELIEDLDRLMMTKKEFSLPYHLKSAYSRGLDDTEGQNFEINLLAQITLFGPMREPVLYDMCGREWGDFLKSFYLMRWRSFFEVLAVNFKKNRLSDKNKNRHYGRDDYLGTEFLRRLAQLEKDWVAHYAPDHEAVEKEETVEVAQYIMKKYGNGVIE